MSMRTTISNYTGSTRYSTGPTYCRGLAAKSKERKRREREREGEGERGREECRGEKNLRGARTESSHIVKYPCTLTPVGFFIAHASFLFYSFSFFSFFITLLSIDAGTGLQAFFAFTSAPKNRWCSRIVQLATRSRKFASLHNNRLRTLRVINVDNVNKFRFLFRFQKMIKMLGA